MCDDLDDAIDTQVELGTSVPKEILMLFKSTLRALRSQSKRLEAHIIESDKRQTAMAEDIKDLKKSFDEYRLDAVKYRLAVELFKFLFGSTKRAILTLVWVGVIFGLVNLKDILTLLIGTIS